MNTALNTSIGERFWSKVDIRGFDDCWPWRAATNSTGYGQMRIRGHLSLAHRLVWNLTRGEIPDEICVCHLHDNPLCCNPNHLWLGSPHDNRRDAAQKGRLPRKLSAGDVLAIRGMYDKGTLTMEELAEHFGVTRRNISHIVNWKTWTWLG